ncbi:hypothetical protein SAMN06272771_0481 [Streptomyces sp. Ag82_O1-12]|uniref:hypothetical protein n=1 Tax=unclassified Streptomyces TaxID=2593676 RepID=UPI000BD87113|nr:MULTISPECIES: hypothetical protein [unclassified Streptomyces]SMQ14192.1 hypothetical protein SAMN06272771_0481 [Streptomyces sp. Ag82_O1-12]SOD43219.1 hypothetical protein SAMN06272727_0470 [Streptomyces sp. Ag82_G6-1]
MTTEEPDGRGAAREPFGVPPVPDEVWLRFLTDSESAIRLSAPREPSARERAAGRRLQPPHAVGDLWQPEDLWVRVAWRDLDRRSKVRRAGRVLATAAAVALALGAWSQLSTGAGTGHRPGEYTVRQVEGATARLPTATPVPSASPVGLPSR